VTQELSNDVLAAQLCAPFSALAGFLITVIANYQSCFSQIGGNLKPTPYVREH
jgi:hypothetical protein